MIDHRKKSGGEQFNLVKVKKSSMLLRVRKAYKAPFVALRTMNQCRIAAESLKGGGVISSMIVSPKGPQMHKETTHLKIIMEIPSCPDQDGSVRVLKYVNDACMVSVLVRELEQRIWDRFGIWSQQR